MNLVLDFRMRSVDKIAKPVIVYASVIFVIWSSLTTFSMWWNIQIQKKITMDTVTNIARASFNKDQAYRQWATSHGGVYVKPTQKTPPSPWMAHLPKRDVETTNGEKLTLMNPAYMLREMMQDYSTLYGIKGRIVGIVYLNEKNKADDWEADAIRSFEKGKNEVLELTGSDETEYLRLMKPMVMNQKCQKCHGHLGFENGSVRGGVSVSVPMKKYRNYENKSIRNIFVTHLIIWLFGILAIVIISISSIRHLRNREKDLEEIVISSQVFNNTLDAIFITNAKAEIIRVNQAFTDLSGYNEDEVIGKSPRILKSTYHDEEFYKNLWETLLSTGNVQVEIINRNKEGELFISIESISSIKDDNGEIKYFIATLHDITARKNAEDRVVHLAHYDPLTDLPNRVLFQDRFKHALNIAQKSERKVALAFLDLDGFKKINDTKGHPFGDKLLKVVSQRIVNSLKDSDTLSRLGGDEFTIIFEDFIRIENILPTLKNILNELTQEILVDNQSVYISASIGVSIYPNDGLDIHTLTQHADTAMYRAKEDGKNRYSFYEETMTKQAQDRIELETSIQAAIENGELQAYYQPKVYASDMSVLGMEALVRWISPQKGLIPPDKFIPVAEEMHIVDKIDMYVLEQVCKDMSKWIELGFDNIKVAVNLSGYDIGVDNLCDNIKNIVESYNISPENLEFEVTETYFVNFNMDNLDVLHQLKEYGFTLSIDDFGTGYSSLGNLQKLPIDVLKIDQLFIRTISEENDNQNLVDTIIYLAKSLGLKVIAEGVETEYQLEYLKKRYCDYIQGYYEAKPMPRDEFIKYLQNK